MGANFFSLNDQLFDKTGPQSLQLRPITNNYYKRQISPGLQMHQTTGLSRGHCRLSLSKSRSFKVKNEPPQVRLGPKLPEKVVIFVKIALFSIFYPLYLGSTIPKRSQNWRELSFNTKQELLIGFGYELDYNQM